MHVYPLLLEIDEWGIKLRCWILLHQTEILRLGYIVNIIKNININSRSKPFFYNISGLNFNLDEIKHGMLRGNKKSPKAYMKTLAWNDPKAQIIKEVIIITQ